MPAAPGVEIDGARPQRVGLPQRMRTRGGRVRARLRRSELSSPLHIRSGDD